jgi:hypothetical protein
MERKRERLTLATAREESCRHTPISFETTFEHVKIHVSNDDKTQKG